MLKQEELVEFWKQLRSISIALVPTIAFFGGFVILELAILGMELLFSISLLPSSSRRDVSLLVGGGGGLVWACWYLACKFKSSAASDAGEESEK